MTQRPRIPAAASLPAGLSVQFGEPEDLGSLRPFWLALHHIQRQADPELAPHVDDETSWSRRQALYEHCLESPTRSCCSSAATAT